MKVIITEKNGVCRVEDHGRILFECPVSFDPAQSLALLLEINALKTKEGRPIYEIYKFGDVHLWSLYQEHLFWSYLQPYIKYQAILTWLAGNSISDYSTQIPGLLTWKNEILGNGGVFAGPFRMVLERALLHLNSVLVGLVARFTGSKFLLWSLNCRWGERWIDYRIKDIYSELWANKVPFIEAFPFPGFKQAIERILRSKRVVFFAPNPFFISETIRRSAVHNEFDWNAVHAMPEKFLRPLLARVEVLIAHAQHGAGFLARSLRRAGLKKVIGIDEHTSLGMLRPASHDLGIELIGLQHGVFHKYSIGWRAPGIPRHFTTGYDRLFVWGSFWAGLLAEMSNVYQLDQLPVGGFIRPSTIALKQRIKPPKNDQFNILLPYEFLANPEEIAAYVRAFLDAGCRVFFKVRFDDTLDTQLQMLPRERLQLVSELTQELIDSINVCAGTSTTMMYELYSMGIPCWFIETKHDSNIHMVDKGLAAKITLSLLQSGRFNPFDYIIRSDPSKGLFEGELPNSVMRVAYEANESRFINRYAKHLKIRN